MSNKIIQLNEGVIKEKLKDLVRKSVEETLNELLDKEAEALTNAGKYERTADRQGYRSGHYQRNLSTMFWGSIVSPSINHLYCCGVIFLTSSILLGHLNFPASSLLYKSRKPSPSQRSPFILSFFLPQKRKSVLVRKGSSSNLFFTCVARPSMPYRRSVYPQAMYTFSIPVASLSIQKHLQSGFYLLLASPSPISTTALQRVIRMLLVPAMKVLLRACFGTRANCAPSCCFPGSASHAAKRNLFK